MRDNKTADKETLTRLMKGLLRGESEVEKTVIGALNALISQYSIEKDEKTRQKFSSLKVHLEKFAKKNPLNFESMDFGFYDKFKNFLYEQPNPVYSKMYLHNQGAYWAMSKIKSLHPVGLMDDIRLNQRQKVGKAN